MHDVPLALTLATTAVRRSFADVAPGAPEPPDRRRTARRTPLRRGVGALWWRGRFVLAGALGAAARTVAPADRHACRGAAVR